MLKALILDVRYALRQLRKTPGIALTVILTLALGIAANSTIFSWIDATLLDPIPGATHISELVSIMRGDRNISPVPPFSYLDYVDLRQGNQSFSGLIAYHDNAVSLTGNGRAERLYGTIASANYFDVLGVRPVLGRGFLPGEEQIQGSAPVVVISYGLWQSRFGGDHAVLGKSLEFNRHRFTIVGVTPEGFVGVKTGLKADAFFPLTRENDAILFGSTGMGRLGDRGSNFLQSVGRLKHAISPAQAEREFQLLTQQTVRQYPDTHRGDNTISFDPLWRSPFGANVYLYQTLPLLLAIAGLVLLLACANVANVLLVRSVGRRREIAVRLAIGASRWHVVRQLLVENLILSLSAGALAALLTIWSARTFASFIPTTSIPINLNGRVDGSVLLATLLMSLVACVTSCILPALRSSNVAPLTVLKEEAGSVSGSIQKARLSRGLVVFQISLSFLLLVCAALFVQSVARTTHMDPGFDAHGVLLANYELQPAGYSAQSGTEFNRQLLAKLTAIPGVQSATLADWVPLALNKRTAIFEPEGYVRRLHETLEVRRAAVGPDYFRTMRIPMLRGRDFNQHDTRDSQRVLIVSQAFANRYWPEQDAIGKRIRTQGAWYSVVGVAADCKHLSLNEPPEPILYTPVFQDYHSDLIIHVRTAADPSAVAPLVERAVHELNPDLPVFSVVTLEKSIRLSTIFVRVAGTFTSAFGILALLLAAVGIYSVVAYSTRQRTHEIGVRIALGAQRRDVLRLVLSQGVRMTGAGVLLGAVLSLGFTRLLRSQLMGVEATDRFTFIAVAFALTTVALIACSLPARRAMRVDPAVALRCE